MKSLGQQILQAGQSWSGIMVQLLTAELASSAAGD